MMTIRRGITLAASMVALLAAASCSPEQLLLGQWYNMHTYAAGTCPAMDWHFVVDAHRSIAGYLDRDTFKQVATLSGSLHADDTFDMTATEAGGNREEHITGAFKPQVVTIVLDGAWICERQTFRLRPLRGFGGGGGGGGG